MVKPRSNSSSVGSVRIVGGRWRGRRLPVLREQGLRPTGDRQRETLFNWLQNTVSEAHCLDVFAGSGVLGLEALSRGAASLQAVELNKRAAQQIQKNIDLLEANACVEQIDWQAFLGANTEKYQLVFIDPPFAQQLLSRVLPLVDAHLADSAWVYVEDASDHAAPEWPIHWQLKKEKTSCGTIVRLFHVASHNNR